jgi:hypothetical protein
MAVIHPELQSAEERQRLRDEANEKAALTAAIPEGAQVVVMAPTREVRRTPAAPARAPTPPPTPAASGESPPPPATPPPPGQQPPTGRRGG